MREFAKALLSILSALVINTHANACQEPAAEFDRTNYYLFQSDALQALDKKQTYVGIATAEFVETGETFAAYSEDSEKSGFLRYAHVKVNFTKMLKNTAPKNMLMTDNVCKHSANGQEYICELGLARIPHPEDLEYFDIQQYKDFKLNTQNRINHERQSFDFYDRTPLIVSQMGEVLENGLFVAGCGPITVNMLQPEIPYLVIGDQAGIISAEPLSGSNDPLVSLIKKRIDKRDDTPLNITPQNFLSKFDYYERVKIMDCNGQSKLDKENLWKKGLTIEGLRVLRYGRNDGRTDGLNFPTTWKVLAANYNSKHAGESKFLCTVGKEYLAIYQNRSKRVLNKEGDRYETLPSVRVMRVENGNVVLSDLITNYIFTQTQEISVKTAINIIDGTSE